MQIVRHGLPPLFLHFIHILLTQVMELDDPADGSEAWRRKCVCGKRFYQPNNYTFHINNCARYKKGVGSSLQEARARLKERKSRLKKGKAALNSWFGDDDLDVDMIPGPSNHSLEETVSIYCLVRFRILTWET